MYLPSDPKVWNEIAQDPLIKRPIFWLPIAFVILIPFLTDEDQIRTSLLVQQFVAALSYLVPSIDTWVQRSEFPSTTGFLFSIYWVLMPYYFLIFAGIKDKSEYVKIWRSTGWKRYFSPLILISIPLAYGLIFYFFAFPEESNCSHECIHRSPSLQNFWGICSVIGITSLSAEVFRWMKNFKAIYFSELQEGENT
ncbi:hypothetical protein [Stenotrophobium rhamnosiphilum]|uniref:Uncharacterized protein n=1 Tax=Stenotrophobium rhamnosiphilum TaxID=2029166 RepID=A0A2T5MDE3_9GAMM|nr:hypothetical protein [Stenotrophobium rhamnosiphilum]PTU30589.1 hypothetical protein CJD38_13870 [Stenotrophobium rhamnosiphilum]